jgi:hypothetical protein
MKLDAENKRCSEENRFANQVFSRYNKAQSGVVGRDFELAFASFGDIVVNSNC